MNKVTICWADGNDEVMDSSSEMAITKDNELRVLLDGDHIITKDNKQFLIESSGGDAEYEIKECFSVFDRAPHHTTDWLRLFCEKHHPEVDFDTYFETNKAGVFSRYQDRFGFDYAEWVTEEKYNRLNEELFKLGYELS